MIPDEFNNRLFDHFPFRYHQKGLSSLKKSLNTRNYEVPIARNHEDFVECMVKICDYQRKENLKKADNLAYIFYSPYSNRGEKEKNLPTI